MADNQNKSFLDDWNDEDRVNDLANKSKIDFNDETEDYELSTPIVPKFGNKTYESNMKRLFDEFTIPPLKKNVSRYRQTFLDMIINGNFRVKFSPSLASRPSANNYCKKKLDKDGLPIYRVLPPNAKDAFGTPITDLNGDFIDEVVIVNKVGTPVVVNGYQLVKADIYKKLYNSKYNTPELRRKHPFNEWMNDMMSRTNEVDWENGQWKFGEVKPKMKKAMDLYGNKLKIGKPRVSKKATPNSVFSKYFAQLWREFWDSDDVKNNKVCKHLVKYLNIVNAMFYHHIESPTIRKLKIGDKYEGNTYKTWIDWKKIYKEAYTNVAGEEVNKFIKTITTAESKIKLLGDIWKLIFRCALIDENINKPEAEYTSEWELNMYNNYDYKAEFEKIRNNSVKNINAFINNILPGYSNYVRIANKHKNDLITATNKYQITPKNNNLINPFGIKIDKEEESEDDNTEVNPEESEDENEQ